MQKIYLIALLSIAWIGGVFAQSPQTITLSPSQDNSLFEDANGALSNGSGMYLFSGKTNQPLLRRAMLRFDVAGNVPANATITGVSLQLFMDLTIAGSTNMSLHQVNASWGEGTSDAPGQEGTGTTAASNDVTWLHRFWPGSNWSNPGGDFAANADATTPVASFGSYTWSAPAMVARVQSWLNSPSGNHGWILIGDESTNPTAKRFCSRENPNVNDRPKLLVTYTVPCIAPSAAGFSFNAAPICSGDSVLVQISGNLNSAATWHVYTGQCGGQLVDTSQSGSVYVSPNQTTTYFVRGEGGCVSPGACTSFSVQVNPTDDPSFAYGQSMYCINDQDPSPQVSGTPGGSFSLQPASMNINSGTGSLDLSSGNPGTVYQVLYTSPGPACPDTSSEFVRLAPVFNTNRTDTICQGDSLLFGSQYYQQAGTYNQLFSSQENCDSNVTMDLVVLPSYQPLVLDTLCQGDTLVYGGQAFTAQGQYLISLQSTLGCDSIIQLQVQEWPVYATQLNSGVCSGDSLFFAGQWLSQAGTYSQVLSSLRGCDSTVSLGLVLHPPFSQSNNLSLCIGDSVFFGGQFVSQAGQYVDSLQSQAGCDSIYILNLSLLNAFAVQDSAQFCQGDSLVFGSQVIVGPGNYSQMFQTASGCDSLVDLNVQVFPNPVVFDTLSICQSDSLFFAGNYLSAPGDYQGIFQSANGCDSTLNLHLVVHPEHLLLDSARICQGDSLLFGGQYLQQAGTYVNALASQWGCDSIVQLQLVVDPVAFVADTSLLCSGDSLVFGSLTIVAGGTYQESFSSVQGCDSVVQLEVVFVQPDTSVSVVGSTLTALGSSIDYQWLACHLGNQPVSGATGQMFSPQTSGTYALVATEQGCSDTSACYAIEVTGLGNQAATVGMYPVPAEERVFLFVSQKGLVRLLDLSGKEFAVWNVEVGWQEFQLPQLPTGLYVLVLPSGFGQLLPVLRH